MASRDWLIREILGILGVDQSGQDLSPEDYERVNRSLNSQLLAMSSDRIYSVLDPDNDIPDHAAVHIAEYIASKYIPQFGLVGDERQMVREVAQEAQEALRRLRASEPTFAIQPAEYF